MALQKKPLEIPIGYYDTKPPGSAGPVGRLTTAENCVAQKFRTAAPGTPPSLKLQKRAGFKALSQTVYNSGTAGTAWSGVTSLQALGNTLAVVAGDTPYVYSQTGSFWERITRDDGHDVVIPQVNLKRVPIWASAGSANKPDVASVGNFLAYSWNDGSNNNLLITDYATGAKVKQVQNIASNGETKIVGDGTQFWQVSQHGTTLDVFVYSTVGAQAAFSLAFATLAATSTWDLIFDSSLGVCLTYRDSVNGTTVAYLTRSGSTINATSAALGAIDSTKALAFMTANGDGFVYVMAISNGGTLKAYQVNSTPAIAHTYASSTITTTNGAMMTGYVTNSSKDVQVYLSITPGGDPYTWKTFAQSITFSGVVTDIPTIMSAVLSSKPFLGVTDRKWYCTIYYPSTVTAALPTASAQPTALLYNLDISGTKAGGPVAGFDRGFAALAEWNIRFGVANVSGHLSHVVNDANGVQHVALGYIAEAETTTNTAGPFTFQSFKHAVGVEDIVMTSSQPVGTMNTSAPVTFSSESILPTPSAMTTTGLSWVESNFWIAPEAPVTPAQSTAGGGGLTPTGVYGFAFVYEWIDANGNWTRSTPSPAISITLTGTNNTVQFDIPTLRLTMRSNVIISVYQTVNGGSQYFKITDDLAPLLNNPNLDTVSFTTGTITDAQLPAHQELYTDGVPATLANEPAPPHTVSAIFQDRIWVYGYDGALWVSKTRADGAAVAFSGFLRIPLDTNVGTVTAMAVMDNRLVLFSSSRPWVVVGTMPDDTGTGTLPTVVQTPSTIGCEGAAVPMRDGIMREAPNNAGIWLLRRDLTDVYIGAPVEDQTLASTTQAVGSINDQIFFALRNGVTLVYDVVLGGWVTWKHPELLTVAGCVWGGQGEPQWTVCPSDTSVVTQTAGYYADETFGGDGAAIAMSIEFSSLNFAGVGGFQQLWLFQVLGEYVDVHSVALTLSYDQVPTIVETFNWTPSPTTPWRYEFKPKVSKCTSMGVKVVETATLLSAGFTLESLGVLAGVKTGMFKVPPTTQRIQGS